MQHIHIYLNLPTYSYDWIFNDRFCPMKNINHLIKNCKFIPTLFVQNRKSHNHESKQGSNACIVFMGVMSWARVIKHISKFPFVCFSLEVV